MVRYTENHCLVWKKHWSGSGSDWIMVQFLSRVETFFWLSDQMHELKTGNLDKERWTVWAHTHWEQDQTHDLNMVQWHYEKTSGKNSGICRYFQRGWEFARNSYEVRFKLTALLISTADILSAPIVKRELQTFRSESAPIFLDLGIMKSQIVWVVFFSLALECHKPVHSSIFHCWLNVHIFF